MRGDMEYRVGKLELKPNDVLVIRVDRPFTEETRCRILDVFEKTVPSGTRMLVIDPAIDLAVLTAEDIASRVVAASGDAT